MAATKLTDAFKSHPVHTPLNLDFDYLEKVPNSYAWIQPNSFPSAPALDSISISDSVPLIDISLPNAAELVCNALRTWGVFQAINHGIPIFLFESIDSSANALFSLPPPEKLKVARTPDGISGYGLARISSFFPKRMWSEGFTIVDSPLDHFCKLWPNDYTKHCDIFEEYEAAMKSLSGRLMWLALRELGITKEDLKWAGPNGDFKKSNAATQFNSYPVCPDPDQAMGIGVHTDTSLLTILYQNTSGLQVLRDGNRWITVEPVAGAVVVQVGDMLHILTNGLYPSVLHQAIVNRTQKRLSVAYLFGPPETAEISPIKKLFSPTQPPLYPTVTWSGFLRTKAELFNNALSSIRLSNDPLSDINDRDQVKLGLLPSQPKHNI